MTLKQIPLLLTFAFATFAYTQTTSEKFDKTELLERLETLSSDKYEGRKTGEKGNDSARAYIIREFKKLNTSGLHGDFEQKFRFKNENTSFNAVNILAEIKGTVNPEQYIVISAHYDHLGIIDGKIYNGADDDASGVSALISFAEHFSKNPPRHSVILAAFDAEEIGLNGSKYFLTQMDTKKIILNMNMDMISRSTTNELYAVGGRYNSKLKAILDNYETVSTLKLRQGHDGTDGKQDWTMASDHGPFHLAKIPFIYFGNEDHDSYHKPSDDFEAITPEFYKNSVDTILSIFLQVDAKGL